MKNLEEYLDQLASHNLSQCLELGTVASEALAVHCSEMGAEQFEVPIEVNGKLYVISVKVTDTKIN